MYLIVSYTNFVMFNHYYVAIDYDKNDMHCHVNSMLVYAAYKSAYIYNIVAYNVMMACCMLLVI